MVVQLQCEFCGAEIPPYSKRFSWRRWESREDEKLKIELAHEMARYEVCAVCDRGLQLLIQKIQADAPNQKETDQCLDG